MNYIDGFVVPVAKKNLAAYKRISNMAGKAWRKHTVETTKQAASMVVPGA